MKSVCSRRADLLIFSVAPRGPSARQWRVLGFLLSEPLGDDVVKVIGKTQNLERRKWIFYLKKLVTVRVLENSDKARVEMHRKAKTETAV